MFRLLGLLLLVSQVWAGSALTGIVTDWSNGRALEGVIVEVDFDTLAVTDRYGRYLTATIDKESVVVKFSHKGYVPYSAVLVPADADMTEFNVELKPYVPGTASEESFRDAPKYKLDDVTVTTTRATSDYPVTFTNVGTEKIDRTSFGQDLPQLFTQLPSVNTYSDGGNGFGYSYLRMRGFSQNRVGVYLNGIPLNDAESHEVFWIDLPDFAEDVQDLQVQRGVGSSLYGASSLGGSINLVTKIPGLGDRPKLRAETMYGTWNTRRASLQYSSGRVADRFGFAGRLTRMESDGYRFGSWVKMWSYYLAASRFSGRHTTRILFYGGPEDTHLAYEGVSKEYLHGEISGNKDHDRRFNPFMYPGEIDHFFQPHYELHDTWRLRDDLTWDNSLYVFRGDGYYDQFRTDQDLSQYFYSVAPESLVADILRRRNIAETDGGWVPRLTWKHARGQSVLGGEVRLHSARHEGTVQWASQLPAGVRPDDHYYDYKVAKQMFAGYLHNLYKVSDPLRVMLDLQVKTQRYEMSDDQLFGVTLEKTFSAFSPRIGANYTVHGGDGSRGMPLTLVYANVSLAQREPAFRDLYNAQDYYSSPLIATDRFANGVNGGEYIGHSLTDEKLTNFEAGAIAQWRTAHLGVNYYLMELRDAIVTDNGQLDDLGNLLSANADKVRHQGIEFVGGLTPVTWLTLSGNLASTAHRFVKYSEVDWNTFELTARDGNRIGQDPFYLANFQLDAERGNFFGGIGARFVGPQYADNSEEESTKLDAYSLVHLDLGYRLRNLPGNIPLAELRLRVNNLLDTEYESVGYGPSYIVGAPRALYTTLAVEL
ncbi:MAG: TonB-dependent receptor plug domain-containing protein [Calditrichaeota bacterium]|nr:TonB-dependent receptor plug domain-containing protein [Calditrichota bacterium]MCB9366924.1 TonB-dependent receptor plug domain-containing protein [Calditrichota bacterium]